MNSGKYIAALLIVAGCTSTSQKNTTAEQATQIPYPKSVRSPDTLEAQKAPEVYSNTRFKEVTAQKLQQDSFLVTGKGQIFEASFGWVIEDGHEELQSGFATTDMGAPEWGNFSFKIGAPKKRPNSTLHLILFETSAKDGSRQYELPILLH